MTDTAITFEEACTIAMEKGFRTFDQWQAIIDSKFDSTPHFLKTTEQRRNAYALYIEKELLHASGGTGTWGN